ncbi:MarC family protein [Jannaschia sp. S6380]|uniref:MarC family protein n=1 Tax=Jannaschia sp. S6380 TaxID=2926408 RepID=UPI001FF408C4|nr:MarC family protein [Jannaschia sp. S6380]MCK0166083.1 MarC family protein [Jannaschia sp. S6380]
MTANELITAFTALFVIIDPIGLAPIFVAMTAGMPAQARRAIAIRACAVGAALLIVFALAGEAVLNFLGISMPAFRIAGGLLLFLTALEMLFEKRQPKREGRAEEPTSDPSVFPLGLPLIAGPGAIATMILLTDGAAPLGTAQAIGVMLTVIGVVFVLFMLATPMERLLKPTGINVVTRLLGMLLAALSVQFVLDGLADLPGWL